ncbi:MAG: hypothetical protein MJY68_08840 [Bacteroidaceae bacterium]|nr:hypothetical protein [Bacteroidaceae bacterium]
METNEALIAILKKSHAQAMAGETVTMNQVKSYMKNKIDELTNPVDAYCVTESI